MCLGSIYQFTLEKRQYFEGEEGGYWLILDQIKNCVEKASIPCMNALFEAWQKKKYAFTRHYSKKFLKSTHLQQMYRAKKIAYKAINKYCFTLKLVLKYLTCWRRHLRQSWRKYTVQQKTRHDKIYEQKMNRSENNLALFKRLTKKLFYKYYVDTAVI